MSTEPIDGAAFQLRTVDSDETTHVILSGEVDLAARQALDDAVNAALDRCSELVFDLTEVTFLDSTGIGAMARALQRAKTVVARNPSSTVRRALEVSGIDLHIRVEPPG